MEMPYCEADDRFLADRYVEGVCPHCDFDGARGDQCDNCGRTLDPRDLKSITCRICGSTPEFAETEHFFLKLVGFEDTLLEWSRKQEHWKSNVKNFTIAFLEGGLRDRAITRDIDWGVPLPLDGYDGKRIYVWFEAVIGYLSASIEWAKNRGEPDRWEDFWKGESRSYYFMGKDNIPFHTIIWPAILLRIRRPQPALRRARQRVHEPRGIQALHQPKLGHLAAGVPGPLRPRPAPLRDRRRYAGDQRLRLLLARVR